MEIKMQKELLETVVNSKYSGLQIRVILLLAMKQKPMSAIEIATELGTRKQALTEPMKQLRKDKLVSVREKGIYKMYRLRKIKEDPESPEDGQIEFDL